MLLFRTARLYSILCITLSFLRKCALVKCRETPVRTRCNWSTAGVQMHRHRCFTAPGPSNTDLPISAMCNCSYITSAGQSIWPPWPGWLIPDRRRSCGRTRTHHRWPTVHSAAVPSVISRPACRRLTRRAARDLSGGRDAISGDIVRQLTPLLWRRLPCLPDFVGLKFVFWTWNSLYIVQWYISL